MSGRHLQPLFLSLVLTRLSVATARQIALVAIFLLAVLILLVMAIFNFAGARPRDESAAIRARYGRLIVPVAHVGLMPGVAAVDVADFDALVRIAEHYDRSILHEATDEGEAFWVSDESGQYRYAIGAPGHMAYRVEQPAPEAFVGDAYTEELTLWESARTEEIDFVRTPVTAEPIAQALNGI